MMLRFDALPDPEQYQGAKPFQHGVVDEWIPPLAVRWLNDEWPKEDDARWYRQDKATSIKASMQSSLPKTAKQVVGVMYSPVALAALSQVSGIPNLLPDPGWEESGTLAGGGLHHIGRGGFLKVHVDFNRHKAGLYRRLNALIYLNEDWCPVWGGGLELWSEDRCERVVTPLAGRMVLFTTSERSWHGHPKPLNCPPDRVRRSLALYYYSKEPPVGSTEKHSTIYRETDAS